MLIYRETELVDVPAIVNMRSDDEVRLNLRDPNYYNEIKTTNWLQNLSPSSKRISIFDDGQSSYFYNISKFVGLIRIDNIDQLNNNCCIGLDITKEYRGKGLATPIYIWLLNYCFNQLNMHICWLEVLAENERAIHLYQKLGFTIDGTLRDRIFRNGKYQNCYTMSIKKEEWDRK